MPALRDLTGQQFGRLTVLGRAARGPRAFWHCQCSCGKQKVIASASLCFGTSRSCGCAGHENGLPAARLANTRHGHSRRGNWSLTYKAWVGMHSRMRESYEFYARYGGRGITVCERWKSFDAFLADMGERQPGATLDRINSDGNYEPSNCRWATPTEQANNRRTSRRLTADGVTMTLAEWSRSTGVPAARIGARVDRLGWTPERATSERRRLR